MWIGGIWLWYNTCWLPEEPRAKALAAAAEKLRPLAIPKHPPRPGDWLDGHLEPGQTFCQCLRSGPTMATGARRTLDVVPLGDFSPDQRRIFDLTAEFLGLFFQLPVRTLDPIPPAAVPAEARRFNAGEGRPQFLTNFILDDLLVPRVAPDTAALIAMTATDLFPAGWNFVFGMASLEERVGVWSMARFGNPARDDDAFRRALLRTIKTAAHETGHMFGSLHCTKYECLMNGSNNLDENDRNALHLCPECLAKFAWACGFEPRAHFEAIRPFLARHGLDAEARACEVALAALGAPPSSAPPTPGAPASTSP